MTKEVIVKLDIKYLMRFIYPGDYYSVSQDDCKYCKNHTPGIASRQWLNLMHKDDEHYPDLKDCIRRDGVRKPIYIYVDKHKTLENGHHRAFAVRELGWDWIPAQFMLPVHKTKFTLPPKVWEEL